ncbi:MAG: aminoglycoside 2'-N-acetyltransferase [Stenotrophomonas sp.]|nr:aminoglycoside 2'-N-acetyltransferase [Stenotrophomonas sp.]
MHVQVSSWDEVVPEQRRQAVELVRSAFPDMQGDGYATPGPVALALALESNQVVAHLALYERSVLLDDDAERIGLIGGVVVRTDRHRGIDFAVLFALDHRHYASAGCAPMQNETCFIEDGQARRFVYRGGMVAALGARRWTTAALDLQGETV